MRKLPPRWRGNAAIAGSFALLLGGVVLALSSHRTPHTVAPVAAPLPPASFSSAPARPAGRPVSTDAPLNRKPRVSGGCDPTPARSRTDVPAIDIPALCIDAGLVPTSINAQHVLVIPADIHQVGLWAGGAGVDDRHGTTLLAGHVNFAGQGNGAFYNLSQVRQNDAVLVTDAAGQPTTWRVVGLLVVEKSQLPASVFEGRTGPRRLVLITCGGPLTYLPGYGNSYADNVVVTAVPAQA